MKANIEIISASAGSGKTTRLAQVLQEAVVSGGVRPDAIVATTFTNKAAAELMERTRAQLLETGRIEDAHRLSASRIGTVNAVCNRLVSEFAFELGQSPSLSVLDEPNANRAVNRALATVLNQGDTLEQLTDIETRMKGFKWKTTVLEIVSQARSNLISSEQLFEHAERSKVEFIALLDNPVASPQDLESGLLTAIERFEDEVDLDTDKTKGTKDYTRLILRFANRLKYGRTVEWREWVSLEGKGPTKKSKALATPVAEAAAGYLAHPQFHSDVARAIDLIFRVAALALESYADYKRRWGVVDFVDQEVLALELLRRPDIQKRLTGELDLVLVDEFQDTSPLQLALFIQLASIAKRCVWVGDQKQAIYGFRGTDPALMDAAVERILHGDAPETLDKSWRSRPSLVEMTSSVFGQALSTHGFPESLVRLEPGRERVADLGSAVEHWVVSGRTTADRVGHLAAAIRQLLADDTVRVWERHAEKSRALRPCDVAVLCRTNDMCQKLAATLEQLDVRAVIPRAGVMKTLEGQVVLAALRLWVDGYDSLAAAELARILDYPDRPNDWLDRVVANPGADAFNDSAVVKRIRQARKLLPHAGAVVALDAIIEATELRELCLGWPDGKTRLGNIDAIRAHAVRFQNEATTEGAGSTPAGLVAHFNALTDERDDRCAALADDNAVVVSTWHKAKGLEWPITVLYQLDWTPGVQGLGVNVMSDQQNIDMQAPLAGRWIRFWPSPFYRNQKNSELHKRLADHPTAAEMRQRAERQELRLLYVGWTRARDHLVLAVSKAKGGLESGMLGHLRDADGPILAEPKLSRGQAFPTTASVTWAGKTVNLVIRKGTQALEELVTLDDNVALKAPQAEGYDLPDSRPEYPLAFVVPSSLEAPGKVTVRYEIGERLSVRGNPEMSALGDAVHGFLAADREGLNDQTREEIAVGLLQRWHVDDALVPKDVIRASTAFQKWVTEKWPKATWHREWPLMHRLDNGSVVRGNADLVLATGDDMVVIDHKSFPGSIEQAEQRAATHAGQLGAYARAIEAATGKAVAYTFIHLPISGTVMQVQAP